MGKTVNWLKLPGPFGFPRYGWIAGIGAMLVAGYIFYRNRKQTAQTPVISPDASGMMPVTYPYSNSGDGSYPPYPPIPATNYPQPPTPTVSATSTQVPSTSGNGATMASGPVIVPPSTQISGQSGLGAQNVMPQSQSIQSQQAAATAARAPIGGPNISIRRTYNPAPPPGAVAPVTRVPTYVSIPALNQYNQMSPYGRGN